MIIFLTSSASLGSIVRFTHRNLPSELKSSYNSVALIFKTGASKSAPKRFTSRKGSCCFLLLRVSTISKGSTYRDLVIILTASSSPSRSRILPRGFLLVTSAVTCCSANLVKRSALHNCSQTKRNTTLVKIKRIIPQSNA